MRVVVGLGNPGNKYKLTRHNAGFIIVDSLAAKFNLTFQPSKFEYYFSEGSLGPSDFFLVKPTTYMNLSGIALIDFLDNHPVSFEDLLVIVDDVNLPVGQVRLRKSGSDGGHNGIKSIIYHLQSDSFPRLRFGVGSEFEKGYLADYVLGKFSDDDLKAIAKPVEFSTELIEQFIIGGYKSMLNYYSKISGAVKKEPDSDETAKKDTNNQE